MGRKCLEAHLVMGPKARQKEEEEVTLPRGACRDAMVGKGEERGRDLWGGLTVQWSLVSMSLWYSVFTMYLQSLATLGMEIMCRF